MPEVVKCPACADRKQQERIGRVSVETGGSQPPPALYRCGACAYLYTVPKLEDRSPVDRPL
jgi:rubredoxin